MRLIRSAVMLMSSFFICVPSAVGQDRAERIPADQWMRYADVQDAGWSPQGVQEALSFADSLGSAAVMLVHDGAVVAASGDVQTHENVYSIAKSLQSLVMGSFASAGLIDLDATLGDFGIDEGAPLLESERRARVRDLLTMRSGVYHPAAYESAARPLPERGSQEPGTFFFYHNWDVNALNAVFEQGTGEQFHEAFYSKIAKPVGLEDYEISNAGYWSNPTQSVLEHVVVRMSARDMARVGLLMLREGSWGGEEVVPSEWVREITRSRVELGGGMAMGYLWWLPGNRLGEYGTFTASGTGNQSIMVLPELDLVFVHRANLLGRSVSGLDAREILFRLIDARTGRGVADPVLVPFENPE
jgi:CubicO group peptidase (beta-lactamase class C family)